MTDKDNKLGWGKTALIGGTALLIGVSSSSSFINLGSTALKLGLVAGTTAFQGLLLYSGYKAIQKRIQKHRDKKNREKDLEDEGLELDEGLTPEQAKENVFGKGVLAAEAEQDNAKFFAENRREEKFDQFNAGYDETWKDFHKHIVQSIASKLEDPSIEPEVREQLENIFSDQFKRWQSYDVDAANAYFTAQGFKHYVDREFTLGDGEQIKAYLDFYVFSKTPIRTEPDVEPVVGTEPDIEPVTAIEPDPEPVADIDTEPIVPDIADPPRVIPPKNTPPAVKDPWEGRSGLGIPKRDRDL